MIALIRKNNLKCFEVVRTAPESEWEPESEPFIELEAERSNLRTSQRFQAFVSYIRCHSADFRFLPIFAKPFGSKAATSYRIQT